MNYFRDKRIDRELIRRNIEIDKCRVYYSLSVNWFYYLILIVLTIFPLFLIFTNLLQSLNIYTFITIGFSYLFFCYLIIDSLSCSIVLFEGEMIIVNCSFLYKKFVRYRLERIANVEFGDDKIFGLTSKILFHVGPAYYLKICILDGCKKYYCLTTERDYYDENTVERNLDDLHDDLLKNDVKVIFNLKD